MMSLEKEKSDIMSGTVKEATQLPEILPEQVQDFALAFIKKLVLAWDPDYTKVTPDEAERLRAAEDNMMSGRMVPHDKIDWD